MNPLRLFFVITCATLASGVWAESQELRPKRVTPIVRPESAPPKTLVPKRRQEVSPREAAPPATSLKAIPAPPRAKAPQEEEIESDPPSLSFLVFTPLVKENVFDARFSTFGLEFLGSFSLFNVTKYTPVFLEFGTAISYSSLTLFSSSFSHLYFAFPLHLRAQFILGRSNIRLDVLGGFQLKPFEYDSRDTTDGGFRSTGGVFSSLEPEVGVGLVVPVGERLRLRGYASYLRLAFGIESTI